MPNTDSDAQLRAFAAASAIFILAGNGLDWAGLGFGGWLALIPSFLVYRLIASRGKAT